MSMGHRRCAKDLVYLDKVFSVSLKDARKWPKRRSISPKNHLQLMNSFETDAEMILLCCVEVRDCERECRCVCVFVVNRT